MQAISFRSFLLVPLLVLLISPISLGQGHPAHPAIERSFELVRARYSGENARVTTAFVEQFWRLPGNKGFDASIHRVETILKEAGYVLESEAEDSDRLTYRIEHRPLKNPTWEPVSATLTIVGREKPLLESRVNRNMFLINSASTPDGGIEAEVVDAGRPGGKDLDELDVEGKIVLAEASSWWLYREAVVKRGAAGILSYSIPDFNQPERHVNSIPFSRIPLDPDRSGWGLMLSHAAWEAIRKELTKGPVRVKVEIETKIHEAEELTIIAEVKGHIAPQQRFVFSAHVQEPGANDNASGVGCQAEMARVAAVLLKENAINPHRTITFLWGDEITSTHRFITENKERAEGVLWGLSLDMVGEDTEKTGGTFLIEKMPDPSAVWPRGDEHFSEWGGQPISPDRLMPHYFNDFIINRCLEEAAATGWVVKTNPFEGGSDHVPFLREGKPSVLLWHFTDVYYHTDGDRIEMVSADTLKHVGVSALVSALTLTSVDSGMASYMTNELERAALARLDRETELSLEALKAGGVWEREYLIVQTWMNWYLNALDTIKEMEINGASPRTLEAVQRATERVRLAGTDKLAKLARMRGK